MQIEQFDPATDLPQLRACHLIMEAARPVDHPRLPPQSFPRFAALTQVTADPDTPAWALQDITAVLPGHRGHRLGLHVKIGMLDLLAEREPGLRRILTGSARSNDHLNSINARLGYQISDIYWSWELDLR